MASSARQTSRYVAIFAGGTLLSRGVGLARDLAISALIPQAARDVFVFAFRLPNMLRDILGEGAMNAAMVPVLGSIREREGEAAFRRAASALFSAMLAILGVVTLLGVLLMPYATHAMEWLKRYTGETPLAPEEAEAFIRAAQWTFPYLFFIGLAVFAMGPLFTVKRYGTPAWSPVLLNIALLIGVFFRERFPDPAYALIFGVWLGGAAQFVVLHRAMGREVGVWRPSFELRHPAIRQVLWLMLPVLIGQAAGEVNKFVDLLFAVSLEPGTPWQLFCANRLVQLPLSVFGVAVSVAILPTATEAASRGDTTALRRNVLSGLRQSAFLVIPATLGLIALQGPLVSLVYERGAFTREDSLRTAQALGMYAAGLWAFSFVKLTLSGFYATHDTRTPVIIGSFSMLLNIALNFALVRSWGFLGLAFATTLSYIVNFVLLYVVLSRRIGPLWDRETARSLGGIVVSSTLMAGSAWFAAHWLEPRFAGGALAAKATLALVPMAVGCLVYSTLCALLRVPEYRDFLALIRRRHGGD